MDFKAVGVKLENLINSSETCECGFDIPDLIIMELLI